MTLEPQLLISKTRMERALHILAVTAVHGCEPPEEDVEALRSLARDEDERCMELNELARVVIARESRAIVSERRSFTGTSQIGRAATS